MVSWSAETRRMRMRPSRIQKATIRNSDAPTGPAGRLALRRDQALRLGEASQQHQPRLRPTGVRCRRDHPTARPTSGSSITSPAILVAGPRQRVKMIPPALIRRL